MDGLLPLREYSDVFNVHKKVRNVLYVIEETSDGSVLPLFARDEGLLPSLFSSDDGQGIGVVVATPNQLVKNMLMDQCGRLRKLIRCRECPDNVCLLKTTSGKKALCTCVVKKDS